MAKEDQSFEQRNPLADLCRLLRPHLRAAIWQASPAYWSLRKRWRRLAFSFLRGRNSAAEILTARGKDLSVLGQILYATAWSLVLSVVLVAVTSAVDALIAAHPAHALPRAITNWLRPDSTASASLLGSLAEIAGVFLGLYFAVLGTLASSRYTDVPPSVRNLIFAGPVGSLYIRLTAVLGTVAVLLLAMQSAGAPIGPADLLLVTLLGAVIILAFLVLGRRAFQFFDPAHFTPQLGGKLARYVDQAASMSKFSRQPALQAHFRNQASALLESWDDLIRTAATRNTSRQHSLAPLAQHLLQLLAYYGARKHRLATDSRWYTRETAHKQWLLSDYGELTVALNTGTTLQPSEVANQVWFEDRLTRIFWSAYNRLIAANHLPQAASLSILLARTIASLGSQMLVTEAIALAATWAPILHSEAKKTNGPQVASGKAGDGLLNRLSIVESYAQSAIGLFLAVTEATLGPADSLRTGLLKPDWLPRHGPYKVLAPLPVVAALEDLIARLGFERKVEGKRETPDWFVRQRVALAYCTWLRNSLDALLSHFEATFGVGVHELIESECWLAAAVLNSRALEACSKFLNNLGRLKPPYEKWAELRGYAEDPWPTIGWQAIEARLAKLQSRIELSAAELLRPLHRIPTNTALPDFFGQALAVSIDACFEATIRGNSEHVSAIFPLIFTSSLAAWGSLVTGLQDEPDETAIAYASQPLDNLMELSGYAILYAELGYPNAWDSMKSEWDNYFSSLTDPGPIAKLMLEYMHARTLSFHLPPGSSMELSGKQRVRDDLRARGLQSDPYGFLPRGAQSPNDSTSPLVRAWLRGAMQFHAADVFLALYLLQQSFVQSLVDKNIGCQRADDFLDAYHREQQRRTTAPNEADE